MADDVLQKIMEVVNKTGVEQFADTRSMMASTGGIVIKDQKSPKLHITVNTVPCPDKEVILNLSSPENQKALEDFTNTVIKSQHIGNIFRNVNLPAEIVELMAVDVDKVSAQCLKNYNAAEAKDPKKIAQR